MAHKSISYSTITLLLVSHSFINYLLIFVITHHLVTTLSNFANRSLSDISDLIILLRWLC